MKTLTHTEKVFMDEVIRACRICYVGLADTDGTPYVIPMNFGYCDGVVYLHSGREGRSISILGRNPQVCITFSNDPSLVWQSAEVACSYGIKARSVIGWGRVRFEEDFDKKVEALNCMMHQYVKKQFKYSDPAVNNVLIWTVKLEEISCKEFGAPHQKPVINK